MLERIHTLSKFRQDKIYSMYGEQPIKHFTTIWDYYNKLNPTFKN